MIKCIFCDKECKSNNSKAQHELYCKSNPNKKDKKPSYGMLGKKGGIGSNQYKKAKELGLPKPSLLQETRDKLSKSTTQWNQKVWQDPVFKEKHRESMRRAVENHPESYTSSNRGRTKQIVYEGIKFQGTWELEFYKWCLESNIKCVRNTQGFKYFWNGKRTYYPDFYLSDLNWYVEVKGYKTERDIAKWNQFPEKLLCILKQDIIDIKKRIYKLPL